MADIYKTILYEADMVKSNKYHYKSKMNLIRFRDRKKVYPTVLTVHLKRTIGSKSKSKI